MGSEEICLGVPCPETLKSLLFGGMGGPIRLAWKTHTLFIHKAANQSGATLILDETDRRCVAYNLGQCSEKKKGKRFMRGRITKVAAYAINNDIYQLSNR